MNVGKALGYALLAVVDALLVPLVIFAFGVLVFADGLEQLLPYLVALSVLSFVGALVAAAVCLRRGGKPFPVTRGTIRVADELLWWFP